MASKARKRVDAEVATLIERGVKRTQLRVWQVMTVETPVLTGFARAGWSATTGQPDTSGPSDAPSRPELATAQASALFATHKQASDALARGYKLKSGPAFITNNVRYVPPLNEGSSAQAPQMFIEMGVALAVRKSIADLS